MCRKTEVDSINNNNNNRNMNQHTQKKTRMLINDKKQHRRVFALLGCCFKILELQTKTSGKKRKERPFSSVVVKRKIGNPGNNQKNLNVSFFLAIAVWVRNVAPRRQRQIPRA